MPKYRKGKGRYVRKRFRFEHAHQMRHWLSRIPDNDPVWAKHFRNKAKKLKVEGLRKSAIHKVANESPHNLARDVFSELRRKKKGENVGGGIAETITHLVSTAADFLGFQQFKEWLGAGPEHRTIPNEDKLFAKALSATYKPVSERPDRVGPLVRVKEYDNPRYSLWQQPNGQYLVAIHGTEVSNPKDLANDAQILAGQTVQDEDVQALFDRLDASEAKYDVAAHSLGTQFVVNAQHRKSDRILLFNPASSPTMTGDYLNELANDPQYTYFISPSDLVSKAIWQKMDDDTVKRSYVSTAKYSPLASHSMSQWYDEGVEGGMSFEEIKADAAAKKDASVRQHIELSSPDYVKQLRTGTAGALRFLE